MARTSSAVPGETSLPQPLREPGRAGTALPDRDGSLTSPAGARWDAIRARRASHTADLDRGTCIECRRDPKPRYLYCSDTCSARSRARARGSRKTAAR